MPEWRTARTEEQGRQGLAPRTLRLGTEVQDAWKGLVDVGLQLGGEGCLVRAMDAECDDKPQTQSVRVLLGRLRPLGCSEAVNMCRKHVSLFSACLAVLEISGSGGRCEVLSSLLLLL